MLYRKYIINLEQFINKNSNKILLVNGARQVGKTYLIRYVGKKNFENFIEINLKKDAEGQRIFDHVKTTDDFYLQLSVIAGNRLGKKENTLVFLDEIQAYQHLLTMLKFLNAEGRYTYIASGSQLGVALAQTPSVPLGSIAIDNMYPLDFEEFLLANGCGQDAIETMKEKFMRGEALNEAMHNYMLSQFKNYLLVGGMPEAVNKFIESRNIADIRKIQRDIHSLYRIDSSQYDKDHKLVIRRIYDMIPSAMENKKKRVIVKNIEGTKGHKQFDDYANEFEYLTNSGVALEVKAISNPRFPITETETKNLLKLYLNDVGILTGLLYRNNINAVLNDDLSVNLGSVYESVVAQELKAHGFALHYYDNKQKGEVDYLIDDYAELAPLPIEVKSGKDYKVHSALDNFVSTPEYGIKRGIVLSNNRDVLQDGAITYMPIYYVMFLSADTGCESSIIPTIEPF